MVAAIGGPSILLLRFGIIRDVASGTDPQATISLGWEHGTVGRTFRSLIQHALLFPVLRLLTPHTVRGADRLKGLRGPVIVVANHVSHLDTPIVVRVLPPAIRSLLVVAAAKDYFYRGRLRGSLVSLSLATVPFDRGEGSRESLRECEDLLRLGRSLLIFPEGTRSATGHLGQIRSGVSVLAIHTRTPVLPLFIHGLGDVMPKGTVAPLPGGVVIDVGEALLPEPDEEIATFRDRVESALIGLANQRPEWGARSSEA